MFMKKTVVKVTKPKRKAKMAPMVPDVDMDAMKKGGSAKKKVKKYKTGGHVKNEGHMDHTDAMAKAFKCGGFAKM